MKLNYKKGFTLIELLVVIAIIGILAAVILASLSNAKGKGNDAKVQSQLKQMVTQSQLFLGTGVFHSGTTPLTVETIPAATPGSDLFLDSTTANKSLYYLMNKLPAGTVINYATDGTPPISGGKWAFAASTSNGSACVDYTGVLRTQKTTVMTTSNVLTLYPNMTSAAATPFLCN